MAAAPSHTALLGRGTVRHARMRPLVHRFAYPAYFLLLPLRSLRAHGPGTLARNRAAWVSFHDRDHGVGGDDCLAWVEQLLQREGVHDADGEIWLQCFPRVFGWVFKPVSFWYCQRADGTLAAVVVEVNNTFGQRHCYLVAAPHAAWGREALARKLLHVSPFCAVQGHYRFRFLRSSGGLAAGAQLVARIDHHDDQGLLLGTSQSGRLQPLTNVALWRAFAAVPWQSLSVYARIHWQALRLWWRGVPWFSNPAPPAAAISHASHASHASHVNHASHAHDANT